MGVANPSIRDRPDVLVRAVQHMLKEKAVQEMLTDAEFRGMDLKVHSDYDVRSMQMRLRIAMKDPSGSGKVRCIDHVMDDRIAKDLGLLAEEVHGVVKNISLRGELYFFRLAKHFPNHLKKVECDGNGRMRVEFKNGQCVRAAESEVEDSEFLAKCGMVYDL